MFFLSVNAAVDNGVKERGLKFISAARHQCKCIVGNKFTDQKIDCRCRSNKLLFFIKSRQGINKLTGTESKYQWFLMHFYVQRNPVIVIIPIYFTIALINHRFLLIKVPPFTK